MQIAPEMRLAVKVQSEFTFPVFQNNDKNAKTFIS